MYVYIHTHAHSHTYAHIYNHKATKPPEVQNIQHNLLLILCNNADVKTEIHQETITEIFYIF